MKLKEGIIFINKKSDDSYYLDSYYLGYSRFEVSAVHVDKKFWTTDCFYIIEQEIDCTRIIKAKIVNIRKEIKFNIDNESIVSVITFIEYSFEEGEAPYELYEINEKKIIGETEMSNDDSFDFLIRTYTYGKRLLTEDLNYIRGIRKNITRK